MADPTRVQMLHMLKAAAEPICVCDFTAAFDLGQPTVSHHLAKLKEVGLVTSFKRGVWSHYVLRQDLSQAGQSVLALIPQPGRSVLALMPWAGKSVLALIP